MLLKTHKLKKSYGQSSFTLGPLDLEIERGTVIGVLGRNGAGKTTLFQLLTGNLDPTDGEVYFENQKVTLQNHAIKRRMGYLAQNFELPKWVTGQEVLSYAAGLHGIKDPQTVESALVRWDCTGFANKPLGACSHGMKKRIALALVTLGNPDLLILDEPFSGLDIFHIKSLEELIKTRQTARQTTILSTHIIPFVAELADQMYFIESGRCEALPSWTVLDYPRRLQAIDQRFFQGKEPHAHV
jgi:ABC-type multidrug transport system ATPase subunit